MRAWAVAAVILYHFQVPGITGGFVGVDIFFVISGFLMTGIVIKGLEQGRFSLIDFYLARARRILPALMALCALLLGLGWFAVVASDYATLSTHVLSSLAFVSNIQYKREDGYFDVASHEKWLLHTWSLSVEWQFYLLLPILLWMVWRYKPGRGAQKWVIVLSLLGSLAICLFITVVRPVPAFFLLPSRAWEMLAGGLVFLYLPAMKLSALHKRLLEGGGIMLMLAAICFFATGLPWPGWRALLPVLAAVMVIAAERSSFFTCNRLAQWLGDRSYSLYLWHWPVLVALEYLNLLDDRQLILFGLSASLLLGHLSFHLIENPARRLLQQAAPRTAAALLTSFLIVLAAVGGFIISQKGVVGRFAPAVELAAAEGANFNPRRDQCMMRAGVTPLSCVHGGERYNAIAIGDSHANALVSALAAAEPQSANAGVLEWSYRGCVFVPGMRVSPYGLSYHDPQFNCIQFIDWVQARLAEVPNDIPVVIIGRYGLAAIGLDKKYGPGKDVPQMAFSTAYPVATPASLAEFAEHVTLTMCQLAKQRPVYLMRPIPELVVNVPKVRARQMIFGMTGEISISMAQYRERNGWLLAAQDVAAEKCGVKILDPLPYLCHDERCYGNLGDSTLYEDSNHLSENGNKVLVPMFAEVFSDRKPVAIGLVQSQLSLSNP